MYPYELFNLFGVRIDLYTIMFFLGILFCFIFLFVTMKKEKFEYNMTDLIVLDGIAAVGGGLVSASLFQSVYDFIENPSAGFTWTGKMTFIGGLIGGVLTFAIIYMVFMFVINPSLDDKSKYKIKGEKRISYALRFIPVGITIAHAFGRLGCFFAGCCYGVESDAWFAVKFATTDTKVIPTNLFESVFLFILTGVMAYLFFKKHFKYNFALYGVAYGIWRFIIEFFRGDDRGALIGNISPSQFWSILLVIGGVLYIFAINKFENKKAVQN